MESVVLLMIYADIIKWIESKFSPPVEDFERDALFKTDRLITVFELALLVALPIILHDELPHTLLYTCFGVWIGIRLLSLIIVFNSNKQEKKPAQSYFIYQFLILLSGILWCIPPLFLFQHVSPEYQLLLGIIESGVVSVALYSFMPNLRALVYFTFPPVISFLWVFSQIDNAAYITLTYISPVFYALIIFVAKSIHTVHKELNDALAEAEQASQAKSEFLANMSHEIRTPMNAIIATGNLLQNKDIPPKSQKEYINKLQYSSSILLETLNNLLDFSKLEAKKVDLELDYFKLEDILESVSSMFSAQIEKKQLDFSISSNINPQTLLLGDALKLGQIVINLISNAIKFTENGSIVMNIQQIDKQDDKLLLKFSISDTGIGISDEDQKVIFDRFSQARNSHSRQYGGTGIGLNISQQLLNLMDSQLELKSTPNIGSEFSFSLWLDKYDNEAQGVQIKPRQSISKTIQPIPELQDKVILVIEDNELNQFVINEFLKSFGIKNIFIVATAMQGIEYLKKQDIDLLLLDIQLPDIDGYEAIKCIRSNPAWDTLPVLCITAHVNHDELQKALNAGMNGLLTKPIDLDKLRATLIQWLVQDKRGLNYENKEHSLAN